ncbi:titin homolog [Parasteatoda tepidariorum]|uniref:titin homolog n=1 Tax=Parasteatoda tepidariorum TaxID=114398 RepID=UPI00077FBAC4|nr:uncharacterized protein LOC107439808 isoform X2 [Parasteatoda tepidariorum]
MSGREIFLVLFGMEFLLTMTGGFAYPAKEIANQNNENLPLPFRIFGFNHQEIAVPQPGVQPEKPTNCYHFYVSQNMSSLLSDATKMLRQVHDKREREWILTFIYRIKSLAEHLRSHPDSQNYEECLGVENDGSKRSLFLTESLRIPQPELYFEDDFQPNQNQKRSTDDSEPSKSEQALGDHKDQDNQVSQKESTEVKNQSAPSPSSQLMDSDNFNSVAESTSEAVTLKKDVDAQLTSDSMPTAAISTNSELTPGQISDISPTPEETSWMTGKEGAIATAVISTEPNCIPRHNCSEGGKNVQSQESERTGEEDELERELHARRQQNIEEEMKHQQMLKERIRKALLEELAPEIKKLRTVGGTADDLIDLWKQSEIDVAKDEEKKRRENDFDYEEEGAAAGDLNSDKSQINYRTIAPSSDQVENYRKPSDELPYVHDDVLVQQLYDAGREDEPLYRSTRALDPQDEYLIISTHIPY